MKTLYNHDTEKWLLGALIQDPELQKQLSMIPNGWMHDPHHEMILSAIQHLSIHKDPIELPSVANVLTDRGQIDQVGGISYLMDCVRFVPTTANHSYYMRELSNLYRSRERYKQLTLCLKRLQDGEDVDAVTDSLRTELREQSTPKGKLTTMKQLAIRHAEEMERRANGEAHELQTYVPDLDALLVGIGMSDMMVLAARPGVGKSAFGMYIAMQVAKRGKRVLICSREMTDMQYGDRMISNYSGINGVRLRKASKLSTTEWERYADANDQIGQLPIDFLFDTPTVEELRVMAQHAKEVEGLDLIVVDYMQIMETTQKKQKRYEEVGYISRSLKMLAKDLHVPVIAMCQVGRQAVSQGSNRAELKPVLSDLRESGNIEQDADIVVFLHHPAGESDPSIPSFDLATRASIEERGMQYIVVNVAKQRQGECGSFGIEYDGAHMNYTCIVR